MNIQSSRSRDGRNLNVIKGILFFRCDVSANPGLELEKKVSFIIAKMHAKFGIVGWFRKTSKALVNLVSTYLESSQKKLRHSIYTTMRFRILAILAVLSPSICKEEKRQLQAQYP